MLPGSATRGGPPTTSAPGEQPTGLSWPVATGLIATHSQVRDAVYTLLLADQTALWTVRSVFESMASTKAVSAEGVRTTLYLLLRDRLMERVPHQRMLTLRLTTAGAHTLSAIVRSWSHGADDASTLRAA